LDESMLDWTVLHKKTLYLIDVDTS